MTPALSIIIPVYNGAPYLAGALESVCRQPGLDQIEVIAIDDGSTDGSADILRAYAGKMNLRCLPIDRTGNWAANTNKGVAAAQGVYVCFLHQDDLWLEGRLAWILETIRKRPGCPVMISASLFITPDGCPAGVWRAPFPGAADRLLEPMGWFAPLLVQNYLAIPAPVFRRDLVDARRCLDENLKYTADWKLWLTLAARHPAVYHPQPTVGFRIHPASQTCAITGDQELYRQQLLAVYAEFQALLPVDRRGNRWRRAAQLGIIANVFLAAVYHRRRLPLLELCRTAFLAGPRGVYLFLMASRVGERVWVRLRTLKKSA